MNKKKTFIPLKTIYSPKLGKKKEKTNLKENFLKYTSISLIYINFQTKRYFNATRINKLCVLALEKRGLTLIITRKKKLQKKKNPINIL